jgi:golgi apparatus protein 1
VIRCLQEKRDHLSDQCRSTLFDQEVTMSESIEFNKPMQDACAEEIETFCDGIPSGHARVLWCLQQHQEEADFGSACHDVCPIIACSVFRSSLLACT